MLSVIEEYRVQTGDCKHHPIGETVRNSERVTVTILWCCSWPNGGLLGEGDCSVVLWKKFKQDGATSHTHGGLLRARQLKHWSGEKKGERAIILLFHVL